MPEHFISRSEAETDLASAAAYIAESIMSADGRAEAMTAVVPLYLERGDVDTAAELANMVDDTYTRDRLLTLVAEKCAHVDDDEYALQLAEAVEDAGLKAQAFERIGIVKASKGQIEKAHEIAAEIAHPDFVHAESAVNQAVSGNFDAAHAILEQIDYPSAKVHALLEIASAAITSGDGEVAAKELSQATTAAAEIEHNEERIRSFIDIGNLLTEANRKDLAIETFDKATADAEALDNIHRDSFLASAAVGLFHAGSLERADRALDLVADKTQTASCLLGYAREYWRSDERTDAMDALEEAYAILKSQRESETRSSKARYGLFTSIAAQFAGFEKGERAIEIAHAIEDDEERTSALTQVAEILTARKEDDLARHALHDIAEDADRTFALIRMSDAKSKNGDADGARETLNEALHMVESVPQLSARSSAYNEIAKRFAASGDGERASEATALNLETIASIRDQSTRVTAVAGAAEVYGAGAELPAAFAPGISKLLI